MQKSISAHLGSTYSLKHNNREIMCANVDSTRSKNNDYFVKSNHIGTDGYRFATIEEIYNKVFEPSWREFQAKQRPCRRYNGTYLEWIREQKFKARTKATDVRYKDKAINEAYEVVFQIGNIDDTGYENALEDARKSENIMREVTEHILSQPYICVITEKELNDPNWKPPKEACLIALNCCLHKDESVCGLHFTFISCANSKRGSKKQALLKKCFEQLGYPTEFTEVITEKGDLIPKKNSDDEIRKDAEGNIIYKKIVKKKGALNWLDEIKDFCAVKMKEEYGWERKPTVGNGRKHLDIEDYKIYKAKERQKNIQTEIDSNADSLIQSAVNLYNDKKEFDNLNRIGTYQLWKKYNEISSDFWDWYKSESATIKRKIASDKNEHDYFKYKQQYYNDLANRCGFLIAFIIKFITKVFFGSQMNLYGERINELLKTREELKRISKQMSSENANIRKMIKNNSCDLEFIEKLSQIEQQMKYDYINRDFER